jgi:hypothetical protein
MLRGPAILISWIGSNGVAIRFIDGATNQGVFHEAMKWRPLIKCRLFLSAMVRGPGAFILGEDVGFYEGSFKVTRRLLAE